MAKKKDSEESGAQGGEYTAGQIQVLKGLEAVRKRPGMYIGSTSARGLHHLVYEVVDNSIDEAMAGFCTHIEVTVHKDNSITVADDGRGIPVDIHPTEKVPGVELAMATLHAGGKFDKSSYKVSGGLHGVGVSVVNALSEYLEVEIRRDGKLYHHRFERGVKAKELEERGKAKGTGTKVTFKPDAKIFTELEYSFDTLCNRLRELAFLNKGLTISLRDERPTKPEEDVYRYEGGLSEYVAFLRGSRKPIHEKIIYVEGSRPEAEIELAMQYDEGYSENTHTFVNNINTHEGGMHLTGFKAALTRTINDYARKNGIFKKDESLSGDDVREGLTCVLSVRVMEPQFEGQTKTKLGNSEVRGAVEAVVNEQLGIFLDETPKAARAIIEKSLQAARAREAARKARDLARKKSALESGVLPGKLADCSLDEPSMCELYLVEGDSAGGCFTGDTQIVTPSGINPTFEELVEMYAAGKKVHCYTVRPDGSVGLQEITNPRVTKRSAQVVRVKLDNGHSVVCTPDHPFMLSDLSYRKADELELGDALMALQRDSAAPVEPHVLGLEPIKDTFDVYDIEVPNTNNFALASGVFVHNSAKQGRDRQYQAILPLKGKILNVERARIDKVLSNDEIRAMITAVGTGIKDEFDITAARYHKVIIMCDADVDGAHIKTLLLTFFFRQMPELIDAGYIYIAQPPLFRIQKGKQEHYAYSEEERDDVIKRLTNAKLEDVKGVTIQRYKGLGEMNPDQLWKTTMDPDARTIMRVEVEDAAIASKLFDELMGDEVEPRRNFIERNARYVKNLDV
jgi:DNA gyrase subunit B